MAIQKKILVDKPEIGDKSLYCFSEEYNTDPPIYNDSISLPENNDKFQNKDLFTKCVGDDINESIIEKNLKFQGDPFIKIENLYISNTGVDGTVKSNHVAGWIFSQEAYGGDPTKDGYSTVKSKMKDEWKFYSQGFGSRNEGTDIGNAIELCMSSFKQERNTNKAIVIISDGEDHEQMAIDAAQEANNEGVVICTVGMGSEKGVPIPIIKNGRKIGIKKDKEQATVLTKLNEENLIGIAQAGNGTYTKTSGMSLDLREILNRIGEIEKTTLTKDRYSTYDDQFQWFLIPALILLLIDFIILEKRGEIDDKISLFKS